MKLERTIALTALWILPAALAVAAGDDTAALTKTDDAYHVNIGVDGDEAFAVEGFDSREGKNPASKIPYVQEHKFRWAKNSFRLSIPCFPNSHHEVSFVGFSMRGMKVEWDGGSTILKDIPAGQGSLSFMLNAAEVGDRDRLELRCEALRPVAPVEGTRSRILFVGLGEVIVKRLAKPAPQVVSGKKVYVIDIGGLGDELHVASGLYEREGPYLRTLDPFFHNRTFRWTSNDFVVTVPVFPGEANRVALEARFEGRLQVSMGDWKTQLMGEGEKRTRYTFDVPADVVGERERVTLQFNAVDRKLEHPELKRELFMILSEVRTFTAP